MDFALASYGFTLLKLLGLMDSSHDVFLDGARGLDIVMHQLGLSEEDILLANLDGEELGLPRHYVARDAATKSVVVSIRGTNSVSDVILDLICDSAPFADGYAHTGMRDAAFAVYNSTVETVRVALAANPGFSLVITGHSMGGGIAVLLTKILIDSPLKCDGIRCYAISPPPVFGPIHAIDPAWSRVLESFILEDDIVPRLSLESARSLVMEIERIDGTPRSSSDLRNLDGSSLLETFGHKAGIFDKREQGAAPLYHAAPHINWLLPIDTASLPTAGNVNHGARSPSHSSVRAEPSMFSQMLITRRCVTSHFPNRYVEAFDRLLNVPPRDPRPRRRRPAKASPHLYYYGELGF
jgi:pimeloyl-ACP methyl ester carboxylesterase